MKRFIDSFVLCRNDIDKRIFKAFVYSFAGAIVSKGLIVLTGIVLARILGEIDYGKYSLLNSTIQTFVTFASMGISATMVRYIAIYRDSEKDTCGKYIGTFLAIIFVMSFAISTIMFIFSDTISILTVGSMEISQLYQISASIILFIAISSALQSILIGYESFKQVSFWEILYGIFSIFIISIFAFLQGIIGALCGMLFSRILYSIILLQSSKRISSYNNIKWKVKFDKQIFVSYKKFTLPSFGASIFVVPVSWILNSILTKNSGYFDMAVYSISLQWVAIVNYLMSLFARAKPIYTQLYAEKNIKELKKQIKRIILVSAFVGISIAMGAILLSKFILGMYGPGYVDQKMVFIIMMLAAAVISVQSQFGAIIESIGKMWIGFLLNILWAFNLTVSFLFLKRYGALGYAIAYLLSYSIHCGLSWIVVYVQLSIKTKKKDKDNEKNNVSFWNTTRSN